MIKKLILTVATFLSLCTFVAAKPLNLNQILEGTCRIGVPGAYGTGTVVAHRRGRFYILTNAHVVGNNKVARVEFFTKGNKTLPLRGDVIWKAHRVKTDVDFAVISIRDSALSTWQPRVIPLAPRTFNMKRGQYITSAGCPDARWPSAFEGAILKDVGNRLLFTPPPVGGQSGSGLFVHVPDSKGELHTRIGAIITWRIGQGGFDKRGFDLATGGAIPMSTLYNALEGKVQSTRNIPANWQTIEYKIPWFNKALGSDGKYYHVRMDNGKLEAKNLPEHIKIIRWPVQEVRNPSNRQFPPINGYSIDSLFGFNTYGNHYSVGGTPYIPDTSNGYPGYPGLNNYGDDNKTEELEDKIKDLENQITGLQYDKERLASEKQQLTLKLQTKNQEVSNLYSELEKLENAGGNNEDKIATLVGNINEREKEIAALTVIINNTGTAMKAMEKEADDVLFQRNVATGGTLFSILSLLGWFLWTRIGRSKIAQGIDKIQDELQDKVEDFVGPEQAQNFRDWLEMLEKRILDGIEERLNNSNKEKATNGSSLPTDDSGRIIK